MTGLLGSNGWLLRRGAFRPFSDSGIEAYPVHSKLGSILGIWMMRK